MILEIPCMYQYDLRKYVLIQYHCLMYTYVCGDMYVHISIYCYISNNCQLIDLRINMYVYGPAKINHVNANYSHVVT